MASEKNKLLKHTKNREKMRKLQKVIRKKSFVSAEMRYNKERGIYILKFTIGNEVGYMARSEMNMAVGKRVRNIRRILNLSSEEMADKLEVTMGHFQKLERGEHAFSLERLQMLRENYGVDLNYLIAGESREEEFMKEWMEKTPQELFFLSHQLVDACEKIYRTRNGEKEEKND